MGVKRPFEEEEFPGFPLKLSKQFDLGKNLTSHEEDFPSPAASLETDFHGDVKSGFYKLMSDRRLDNNHVNGTLLADSELETSSILSLTPSSNGEDNVGKENATFGSYVPAYFDFSISQQPEIQFENPYFSFSKFSPRKEVSAEPDHPTEILPWGFNSTEKDCVCHNIVTDNHTDVRTQTCVVQLPHDLMHQLSLSRSPRKDVAIGPDHQADVLLLDRNFCEKGYEGFNERELRLMGTCILPMPDDFATGGVKVARGRTACRCLDSGSEKCVRLHISQAREALQETIGDEKFADLGFYDMGEEVAFKWTSEDEHLFHEIIFSYPMSLGRNFWRHLSVAFPTRTMKEITSYYFNVFMLRRRAIQNRSVLLDADSDDDDEQKGANGNFYSNISHLVDSDSDDTYHDSDNDEEQDNDGYIGGSECNNDDDDVSARFHGYFYQVPRDQVKPTIQSFGNQESLVGHLENYSSSKPENVTGL